MKTLIWKELRELRVIAALSLIVFTGYLVFAGMDAIEQAKNIGAQRMYGYSEPALQPLLASKHFASFGILCAVLGGLLGWMQVYREQHRDLWAFLTHRPVAPAVIFQAKVMSGLLAYALSTILPWFCFVLWVRSPGNVAAPFEWAMAGPSLTLLLLGPVCYFCSILICLRQARWHGSRLVPLAIPALLLLVCLSMSAFWQAFVLIAAVTLMVGASALGEFLCHGQASGRRPVFQLLLSSSLTIGFTVILGLGLTLLLNFANRSEEQDWSHWVMSQAGEIHRMNSIKGVRSITDNQGNPILDPKTGKPMDISDYNNKLSSFTQWVDTKPNDYRSTYLNAQSYLVFWYGGRGEVWMYQRKLGRVIGFDSRSCRLIGSIGPDGFQPVMEGAERFADKWMQGGMTARDTLQTESSVYKIDVTARMATPFYTIPAGDQMLITMGNVVTISGKESHLAVITAKSITLFDPDRKLLWQRPYEPGLPSYSKVQINTLSGSDKFALWIRPSGKSLETPGPKPPSHVTWIDEQGNSSRQETVPDLESSRNDPPTGVWIVFSVIPLPLLVVANAHSDEMARFFLSNILFTLLCASVGLAVAIRHSLPVSQRLYWALLPLVGGLPALLALACVRDWPTRVKCATCGTLRSVEKEKCAHCHGAFPAPEKNGVEIFETVTAE